MEASSGPRRSSAQEPDGPGDGADLISTLPDELPLLVLARLPCTGVLPRRWLGLWAGLRQIVFRGVALPSLEEALGRVTPPAVSIKQQRGPVPTEHWTDSAAAGVPINSLLRAAARLDPEKLDFRLPSGLIDRTLAVDLPCFQRATSIALDLSPITLAVPAGADFPALETLSLARCSTDLDALLSCCPRLRTLRLSTASDIRVNSPSLQELVVCCETSVTRHVDIVAPALKQLAISLTAVDLSISVLAPMVEKVSWHCLYFGPRIVFGLWGLNKVQLQSAERQGEPSSLCIYACAFSGFFRAQAGHFKQEIEKHMVAAFSGLELHLTARGHAFGALVFHLLRMNRIRTATRRLKVVLERSTFKEVCPPYCPCESNWRSQTISLDALEEVEFNEFDGADHEFDLLELILGCAPTLKRMIVKLSEETSASNDGCAKIDNIFKAWSSVECDVYHSSGLMHGSQNCPST
ncbi:hypothetical protein VPH35_140375 [Triticum aestivum]|uniref:MEIOTIC F-BOX protein MOF-like n=1 Tax=Triticum aestivum TaxID=4565 RepID=UPI001D003AA6|nr:MEIOTIC F-BOX protein MOF-like [Triticum aestivum]